MEREPEASAYTMPRLSKGETTRRYGLLGCFTIDAMVSASRTSELFHPPDFRWGFEVSHHSMASAKANPLNSMKPSGGAVKSFSGA